MKMSLGMLDYSRMTLNIRSVHVSVFLWLGLTFLFSGCLVPPILYPRTSVHGVVLDESDNAVSNVVIEAYENPPRLFIWNTPTVKKHLRTDAQGRWHFGDWKVGRLFIEAMPPEGYEPALGLDNVKISAIGPFRDGDCPTNEFILRLKKVPGLHVAAHTSNISATTNITTGIHSESK